MEDELGQFAEESLEQFIGGEDRDVDVQVSRLNSSNGTDLHGVSVRMDGHLGQFAEESLEQFIGIEDQDVNVEVSRLE